MGVSHGLAMDADLSPVNDKEACILEQSRLWHHLHSIFQSAGGVYPGGRSGGCTEASASTILQVLNPEVVFVEPRAAHSPEEGSAMGTRRRRVEWGGMSSLLSDIGPFEGPR